MVLRNPDNGSKLFKTYSSFDLDELSKFTARWNMDLFEFAHSPVTGYWYAYIWL